MSSSQENQGPKDSRDKHQDRPGIHVPSESVTNEDEQIMKSTEKTRVLNTPKAESHTPPFIGKYQIRQVLGHGGMGVVYLALNPDTEGLVAIKTLPDNLQQKKLIIRLKREAKLAAKINHTNAVRVLDAGYDDKTGKHYIVTEYVDGEDLERIMAHRGGRIPWPEVVTVAKSVAKALGEAAKHGIVHRDIKPANIMVASNGVVKLTDLGVAKQMDVESKLTIDQQIVGTPAYLSPEQIQSPQDVDTRSDIYSLGATFYHILTGSYPHSGKTHYDTMRKIVSEPPPDICKINPEVPEQLRDIICKMMEKDRTQRFQNADEILSDLYQLQPEGKTPSMAVTLVDTPIDNLQRNTVSKQAGRDKFTPPSTEKGEETPKRTLLILVLVCFFAAGAFYYVANNKEEENTERLQPPSIAEFRGPQQKSNAAKTQQKKQSNEEIEQAKSFNLSQKEQIADDKGERRKSFQVPTPIEGMSVDTVDSAEPENTETQPQKNALHREDDERRSELLEETLKMKSVILSKQLDADKVQAERWADSTYQLGVLALKRGEVALSQGRYEAAKQAYSEGTNYFKLSIKEALTRAKREAIRKKAAKELQEMRENVLSVKQGVLEKKLEAERLGAQSTVSEIYQTALLKQEEGDDNLEKSTPNTLLLALKKYTQAASLYERAIERVNAISLLKEKADFEKDEMSKVKSSIPGSDDVKNSIDAYKKAHIFEKDGVKKYQNEDYDQAQKLFLRAKNQYVTAKSRIIEAIKVQVEEVRSTMLKAKEKIDGKNHPDVSYQEALRAESQGNKSYSEYDFEKAAQYFQVALELFETVKRVAINEEVVKFNEEDAARAQIHDLVKAYKQHLQERDVIGLSTLLGFSKREERSWRDFFRITININCRIDRKNLEILGNKATLELEILLSYLNKYNSKWEDRNFPMTWKLEEIDGIWTIISR